MIRCQGPKYHGLLASTHQEALIELLGGTIVHLCAPLVQAFTELRESNRLAFSKCPCWASKIDYL